jgi:hypothetical protein
MAEPAADGATSTSMSTPVNKAAAEDTSPTSLPAPLSSADDPAAVRRRGAACGVQLAARVRSR